MLKIQSINQHCFLITTEEKFISILWVIFNRKEAMGHLHETGNNFPFTWITFWCLRYFENSQWQNFEIWVENYSPPPPKMFPPCWGLPPPPPPPEIKLLKQVNHQMRIYHLRKQLLLQNMMISLIRFNTIRSCDCIRKYLSLRYRTSLL